ncbi:hypothetical protein SAMN05443247_08241 [Bradyrhizobium erythrophlei]|nr:hypothetical protein SAMN05443247_08241 [Bradyrhizobium erythrophlei]
MARRTRLTMDTIPLFADDEEIGEAVLGFDRRREFRGLAELHEPAGMPKIDPAWGGRYVPAVKAYFDRRYGLSTVSALAPPGKEGSFHVSRRTPRRNPP